MRRTATRRGGDVPYLRKSQIEAEASRLLAEYGERHGAVAAPPIPIDEIVELHLELTFEFKDMQALFGFGDVHGALWMRERLVGVDQGLDPERFPKKLGRFRFTLAHEAGHWRLHRPYYVEDPRQARLFADGLGRPAYVCRTSQSKARVEWQADYFAACLLMPREMVLAAWRAARGDGGPLTLDGLRRDQPDLACLEQRLGIRLALDREELLDAAFEEAARPLAERFEVSAQAMRIRLEQLGLLLRRPQERNLFTN